MPTYEYGCKACGHQFERDQSIKDAPIKTCPECKKRKVQRLISGGAFILKGGGWYADAYSGPSNNQSGSSPLPATESPSSASEKSSSDSSASSASTSGSTDSSD